MDMYSCPTCHLTYFTCPGHFGHIELPAPVFHPLFMVNMYHLLRGTCLFCHRFKIERKVVSDTLYLSLDFLSMHPQLCKYVAKLRLLEHGLLVAAQTLDDIHVATQGGRRTKDAIDEEEDDTESDHAFEQRINTYVAVHLATASSSKRDSYKDSLVYQARKELIDEFLKATMLKKCRNPGCGAYVLYTLY